MRIGNDDTLLLDPRPLLELPTRRELREFGRTRARPPHYRSRWLRTSDAWAKLALVTGIGGSIAFLVAGTPASVIPILGWDAWPMLAGAAAVLGVTLVPLGLLARRYLRRLRPLRHWYLLQRLADANGLEYAPEVRKPDLPGSAFRLHGQDRALIDVFTSTGERPVQFGNYHAEVGRVGSVRRVRIGFVRIALDHPMPHFVMLGGGGLGHIAADPITGVFGRAQRISLEGDFDRYFRVYAPVGYDADVRFVLTPDFMASLVDGARGFDIELIDSDLYVYAPAPFDLEFLTTHLRIRDAVATIGARALRRARRFTDDRVPDPRSGAVAPQGRRMRWSIPVTAAAITVCWIGLNIAVRIATALG